MLTACLFNKIDAAKHFPIIYKSVLSEFTQEFSLAVWFQVRPESKPQNKLVSVGIFGSFVSNKKKKITRSSAPPLLPQSVYDSLSTAENIAIT